MVIAFRRWCDAFTEGQGAPWSPIMGAPPITGALRRAPREEVLERRHSHVAHCAACTGAEGFRWSSSKSAPHSLAARIWLSA